VVAIKGRDTDTSLILSVSKADTGGKRRGLRVWNVSGPVAKTELYRWLKLPRLTDEERERGETEAPGSCHFPEYGEQYFKQLTAERRVIRIHKGFPRATWEKDPTRNNEALDCRVYARAAASIYGLDRFTDRQWQKMRETIKSLPVEQDEKIAVPTSHPAVEAPQPGKTKAIFKQRATAVADDPYL
jgi:phage terminase large subunit GpA-like protein